MTQPMTPEQFAAFQAWQAQQAAQTAGLPQGYGGAPAAPQVAPAQQFTAPANTGFNPQFGAQAPQVPVQQYGAPAPQAPAQQYGAPAPQQAPQVEVPRGTLAEFSQRTVGHGPAVRFPFNVPVTFRVLRDACDDDLRPQKNKSTGQIRYSNGQVMRELLMPVQILNPDGTVSDAVRNPDGSVAQQYAEGKATLFVSRSAATALKQAASIPGDGIPRGGAVITMCRTGQQQRNGNNINTFAPVQYIAPAGAVSAPATATPPVQAPTPQAAPVQVQQAPIAPAVAQQVPAAPPAPPAPAAGPAQAFDPANLAALPPALQAMLANAQQGQPPAA
jgi:hypothetical protein